MTPQPLLSDPSQSLEVYRFTGGPFGENTYLLRCAATDRVAAIDPGAAASSMMELIGRMGWELESIYLTHAHVDHVEGIPAVRRAANVPIYLHPSDRKIYDHAEESAAWLGFQLEAPLPDPDRDLTPGETVEVGNQTLEVRFAPGHAPGHVMFCSPESRLALVGDVIFRASIGRTDLPGGDMQTLMESIHAQVLTLPDDTKLLPGHGEVTTVRDERLGNPFLISQIPGRFA